MLSILIPTYNYSVTELLLRLKEQIMRLKQPVEVLVCDDASTNSLIAFKNKKQADALGFSYLQNSVNLGRTATRDVLANQAINEWLLFLDADVLPKNETFLKEYLAQIASQYSVIFGGIAYAAQKPPKDQLLRWTYGKKRETKSVTQRNLNPHFIISQNLCITKTMFLACNTQKQNGYGLDNLFSNNLKHEKASVLHIDNPVIHLGLETSVNFISKSLDGINTTVALEAKGAIESDLRPIQRVYLRLKKNKMLSLFTVFATLGSGLIKKNLASKHPSLLLFDIYRLQHLIKLKKHD